uniref:Uncharacterized protein n=1 Tax=Armadillidium vulgare clopovirus TaxID=2984284 RepID=A0A9C7F0Z2_9VIRU|nr:MAG: hypothetical protein [Armadillidium vulgare clopovirus]
MMMNSLILNTIIEYNNLVNYASEFYNHSLINYGMVLTLYRSLFRDEVVVNNRYNNGEEEKPLNFFGIDLRNLEHFSEALYEITLRSFRNANSIQIKGGKTNKEKEEEEEESSSRSSSSSSDNNSQIYYKPLDFYYANRIYKLQRNAPIDANCQEDVVKKILVDYLIKQGDELYIMFLVIKELKRKVSYIQNLYIT